MEYTCVAAASLLLQAARPISQNGVDGQASGIDSRHLRRQLGVVPLVLGLGFMFHAIPAGSLVPIHMLLGIIVIGLVEGAAGQERRAALRGGGLSA